MAHRLGLAFLAVTVMVSGGATTELDESVSRMLDDFHDAAAKADLERYFGHFAPEGRFLGTDGTENWTLGEFRDFAAPHFEKAPAWVYEPGHRDIAVDASGSFASFHEVVVNEQLGECRGTGTLRRIDEAWKIVQYNLTVPIPNELVLGVVADIRGRDAAASVTTVYLVRHAEKVVDESKDPDLTDAGRERAAALARTLRSASVDTIISSEYRRTRNTVQPLAEASGVATTVIKAPRMNDLIRKILRDSVGKTVVVCGHSNTLPPIIARLGVAEKVSVADEDYDNLFLVTIEAGKAKLTRLHYGAPSPSK